MQREDFMFKVSCPVLKEILFHHTLIITLLITNGNRSLYNDEICILLWG